METNSFVHELEAFKAERLSQLEAAGQTSLGAGPVDVRRLLEVALTNEINVSELAAAWTPSTPEIDVKLAFARQAGDEAGHFQLVADRLTALGFDVATFKQAGENPLFRYLRGLSTTVERVAAGLFTLESIAYAVNESFISKRRVRPSPRSWRSPTPAAPRPPSAWGPPVFRAAEAYAEELRG